MMKKYKKLSLFILLLTVLLIVGGVAYAFFQEDLYTKTYSFTGGKVELFFNDNNQNLTLLNNYPMTEDEVLESNNPIGFTLTLTNTTNKDIGYDIKLLKGEDLPGYLRFRDSEVSYALYRNNVYLTHGTLEILRDNVLYYDYIKPNTNNEVVNYKLYLFINDTVTIGNSGTYLEEDFPKTYANFNIEIVGTDNRKLTLYDMMRKNSLSDETINYHYKSSSSNGEGLFEFRATSNDHFPVYFYRGNIDNNFALYNGDCFRIMRTTENGGIRLIPYGTDDNYGRCNPNRSYEYNGTDKSYSLESVSRSSLGLPAGWYEDTLPLPESVSYFSDDWIQDSYSIGEPKLYAGTDFIDLSLTGGWGYQLVNQIQVTSLDQLVTHPFATSTSGTSSTLYYVYYVSSEDANYVSFSGSNDYKFDDVMSRVLEGGNLKKKSPLAPIDDIIVDNYILDDSPYCNDKSFFKKAGFDKNGDRTDIPVYNSKERVSNNYALPSLECTGKDRYTTSKFSGNGALNTHLALPTVDELMLAGSSFEENNPYTYFTNPGQTLPYATMSPAFYNHFASQIFALSTDGTIIESNPLDHFNAFYVTTIKHNTLVLKGDGTINNPYVLG